ncbi:MAG: hypothetical protein C0513_06335 [Isosphaera sp.]|nr:hypothetical protein [Isosphaera sp.]
MRLIVIILAAIVAIGPAGPMLAMVNGAPCCTGPQRWQNDPQELSKARDCPLCVGAEMPGDRAERGLPGPESEDSERPCSSCRCCALVAWAPTRPSNDRVRLRAPARVAVAPRRAATRALETPTPPPRSVRL